LFVVEQNRVLMYPAAEFFYESPDVVAVPIVPQGELIPKEDESYNHTARTCRVGPDNKLYITLGQPFNVPAPEKLDGFKKWGTGGIIRMDRDGKNREVYAWGVRNSVGVDFSPKDKTLWFTDNQVDGMGDDQPPGELNHATKAGHNFGFPYYGGGHVRTEEYKNETPPPTWSSRRLRRWPTPPTSVWLSTAARCSRRNIRVPSSPLSMAPGIGPYRSAHA
jgi:glucose/arabinose dehydrogenase